MASNLISKIGSYFLVKDPRAVPNKQFTSVVIKKCDGSDSVCFSDARIKFETGWSVFLSLFWYKSISKMLVDKIVNAVKSTEDDLYEILVNFLQKGTLMYLFVAQAFITGIFFIVSQRSSRCP